MDPYASLCLSTCFYMSLHAPSCILVHVQVTGSKIERLLDAVGVSVNKNSVAGDVSAVTPGGVRIGTLAMTTRGMGEGDMIAVAHVLVRGVQLAQYVQMRVREGADPSTGTGTGTGIGTCTGTGTGTGTKLKPKSVSLAVFTAALSGPGADEFTVAAMASLKVP